MLRAALAAAALALVAADRAGAETIQVAINTLEYSPAAVESRVGVTV